MSGIKFFSDERLKFVKIGPQITRAQIISAVVEDFPGKDLFVQFYLEHNGGWFDGAPYFPRGIFNCINPSELADLPVDGLYYIPPDGVEKKCGVGSMKFARERNYEKMDEFNRQYIPVAGFDGIIEIWIDVSSGKLIYIEWESMDPFKTIEPVASSFFDFVSNIVWRPLVQWWE